MGRRKIVCDFNLERFRHHKTLYLANEIMASALFATVEDGEISLLMLFIQDEKRRLLLYNGAKSKKMRWWIEKWSVLMARVCKNLDKKWKIKNIDIKETRSFEKYLVSFFQFLRVCEALKLINDIKLWKYLQIWLIFSQVCVNISIDRVTWWIISVHHRLSDIFCVLNF